MSELKKRHAEDFLASERAKMAKSYSGAPSPAHSLIGAYPSAQNPWTAGYGVQPQAWPPATQAQAQQYPAYGQQVICHLKDSLKVVWDGYIMHGCFLCLEEDIFKRLSTASLGVAGSKGCMRVCRYDNLKLVSICSHLYTNVAI